jgi:hypothetical protein
MTCLQASIDRDDQATGLCSFSRPFWGRIVTSMAVTAISIIGDGDAQLRKHNYSRKTLERPRLRPSVMANSASEGEGSPPATSLPFRCKLPTASWEQAPKWGLSVIVPG